MDTDDGLPDKTISNESPHSIHIRQGTRGAPAALAIISAVKENPSMTVAIVALGLVIAVGFLSWYGEREGRLAQYTLQDYLTGDGAKLEGRVTSLERDAQLRRELDDMHTQLNKLQERRK